MNSRISGFLVILFASLAPLLSIWGQIPNLRSISGFALFTTSGAVGNTAISHVNGDIGTNAGAITGFEPPTVVNGSKEISNNVTVQAASDLQLLYLELFNTPATSTGHTPAFGGGETLVAGVYSIPAAGSLAGNLILDAGGDSNAIFIFKFGGAFNTGAASSVSLINGALASNVFWIAEGEIAMAASTAMKGTLIANNGAISIGANGTLVGRMLSTTGAVNIYGSRISLTPFPFLNPGETPDLGSVANFAIFTSGGAIDNTGTSTISGNIGTDVGDITGFGPPSMVNGSIEIANAVTAQAVIDLDAAYVQLYNTPATSSDHTPVFGLGETLTPGVYAIAAAGSVAETLILDAQGNPDAVFIFRFGGALTTGAGTTVTLINRASACNVFWVSEGATSMAAMTIMKGRLIANNGAISMGAGGKLEGNMWSTLGAASVYADDISACASSLPIRSLIFSGLCKRQQVELSWSTISEINNDFFNVERSAEGLHWEMIGLVRGNGNSDTRHLYSFTDSRPMARVSFYRLKQTDFNGSYTYSQVVSVKNCGDILQAIVLYPNPSDGIFRFLWPVNKNLPESVRIYNARGQKVFDVDGDPSRIDISNQPPGIYLLVIQQQSNFIDLKLILK